MVFQNQRVESPRSGGQRHEDRQEAVEPLVPRTIEIDQCLILSEEELLLVRTV